MLFKGSTRLDTNSLENFSKRAKPCKCSLKKVQPHKTRKSEPILIKINREQNTCQYKTTRNSKHKTINIH